jgi:hypothetical protein
MFLRVAPLSWGYIGANPLWNYCTSIWPQWPPSFSRKEKRSRYARDNGIFIFHAIYLRLTRLLSLLPIVDRFEVETVALIEKYSARRGVGWSRGAPFPSGKVQQGLCIDNPPRDIEKTTCS